METVMLVKTNRYQIIYGVKIKGCPVPLELVDTVPARDPEHAATVFRGRHSYRYDFLDVVRCIEIV